MNTPYDRCRRKCHRWLHLWNEGNEQAIERVTALVYGDLRRLAAYHLNRESHADTLQPTALVHEAYLRVSAIRSISVSRASKVPIPSPDSSHRSLSLLAFSVSQPTASIRSSFAFPTLSITCWRV